VISVSCNRFKKKANVCVSLPGDMERATVLNSNPVDQALSLSSRDLKEYYCMSSILMALSSAPRDRQAVEDILHKLNIPVRSGGGVRDMRLWRNSWIRG